MGRFLAMIGRYHGQLWNAAEPARSLGVGPGVVRMYSGFLTDAFMIRQLQSFFVYLNKRQVKVPNTYKRDSGLLQRLLGIDTEITLLTHPRLGAF
ncbi:MAG: DUF4143 domain-containing protein [Albidovulum sp.]|nr:DUF4143 domain-containing protein [Albidovulum sp.]